MKDPKEKPVILGVPEFFERFSETKPPLERSSRSGFGKMGADLSQV
ncbi:hypothetical protein [Thioalkalivibrio sp. HK1]|nr:hypothetical protein [Thioalkalivibrio sp. HK1]